MHSEPLFRPWGIVDPAFWTGSEEAAGSPSPDLTGQLADIRSTASKDLARANVLAEDLDARITAAHGEAHAETVRVREVRAYLAHLTGHHDTAVAWYLDVVRLHAALHGPEHPETALAVRRAYSMWKALPPPEATRLADDLLDAFTELGDAGQQATLRMRNHLEQLHQPRADALAGPTLRLRTPPLRGGE
ncbi:hypothetical protein [Streptomyces sp. NPDC088762]|uniref:hypothetical protein n=1 Tax=Streptomyces sp. NPDC088762 TaxID=3365891 RepID=UPI0038026CE9